MIEIVYKGYRWRSNDFDYSPADYGSYYNPPEPAELAFNELEISFDHKNTIKNDYIFFSCPTPIICLMEEDDEFMKLFEKAILDSAREYEPRDSCSLAGEDSCG